MAGSNPGMVIKVAADITEAQMALAEVTEATGQVGQAAEETNTSMLALGVGIGVMAAEAAGALIGLAVDAVQALGRQLWDVIDTALELTDRWHDFKDAVSDSIRESGVLQAGIDALGAALLEAFGGTRAELVRTLATLINRGAIEVLRLLEALIWLGEQGVKGVAALLVPIDAVLFAIAYLAERVVAFETTLVDLAAQVPGIGSKFEGLAESAHEMAAATSAWRDETYNQVQAHQALVRGEGAVFEWSGKVTSAIEAARVAMISQQHAADAATTSTTALADANSGLVEGTGEAAVALYNQTEALQKMDDWSRKIKNTDPWAYLKEGMTKTLPPLQAMPPAMKDVGTAAIDMADDVKFAAEVVQKASLSWSEAMDLVRQGQGTMTGQIGKPTRPAGMSDSEWALMQSDPRQWELIHGFDWDAPNAGTAAAWSMGGGGTAAAGPSQTNNITVNTVAGDKQAIAAVVKDALASDWRSQGMRG